MDHRKKMAYVLVAILLVNVVFGQIQGSYVWAEGDQMIENSVVGSGEATESSGEAEESSGEAAESSGEATESSGDAEESSGEATESSGEAEESSGDAIDVTSPEVVLVCDSLIAEVVTCKLKVSDENFDPCDVCIYIEKKTSKETVEMVRSGEEENLENDVEKQLTFTEEGRYRVYVEAIDKEGNSTRTEEIEFIVDSTAPVLTVQGVPDGYMTKEIVEVSLEAWEDHPDKASYELTIVRSDVAGELERVHIQGDEKTEYDIGEGWKETDTSKGCSIKRQLRFQEEGMYQLTFSGRDLAGNQGETKQISFYIDRTAPIITDVEYYNKNGGLEEQYNHILSNQAVRVQFHVRDQVTGVKPDEVYIQLQDGSEKYIVQKGIGDCYSVELPTALGVGTIKDSLVIWAKDYMNNETRQETKQIVVNGNKPVIKMDSNQDAKKWTNENVTLHTTVTDENVGLKEIEYKVAGKSVHKVTFDEMICTYTYDLIVSKEAEVISGSVVTVEVTNNAGTKNEIKRYVYIDKTAPKVTLSGIENGTHYNHSQIIKTNVQEISYKGTKTIYYVTRSLGGRKQTMPMEAFLSNQYEEEHSFEVSKEGAYEIFALTTDAAGNQKKSNTLSFVIDKTPPELGLEGVEDGKVMNYGAEVRFICEEMFYKTCDVDIQVERTLDGTSTKMDEEAFSMTQKKVDKKRIFEQDGSYKIWIRARDKAGNIAQTKTVSFTVDCTAPQIRIVGTKNYQMWSGEVALQMIVEESYYENNRVIIYGTRKDINGKVERLGIPFWNNKGKVSQIEKVFSEDGVYAIEMIARDAAGNQSNHNIHFTIDQTKPVLRGISQYNGGYFQYFQMKDSMQDIFQDLTVVSYQMLLNGVEYNGRDFIDTEGKYTLYVEAEDELGHKSHQSAEFIIDHTPPRVIFEGIGISKMVTEQGEVTWKLEDATDRITGVRINDKKCDVKMMSFPFKEYGAYHIEIQCEDKAGNVATEELRFVYRDSKTPLFVVSFVMSIIIFIGIGVAIYRKRKEWK